MTVFEANAIIDSVTDNDKASWEKVRWLGYITCLSQGAKLKTPQELITFSWEETSADNNAYVDTRSKEEIRNSLLDIKNSLL